MNKHLYLPLAAAAAVFGFSLTAQAEPMATPMCVADACRPHTDAAMAAKARLDRANAAVMMRQGAVSQLQTARVPLAKALDDQTKACTAWRASKPKNPSKALDDQGTDCENRRVQAAVALSETDARLNAAIAELEAAKVEARIAGQGLSLADTALANCKKVCRITP